MEISQSLLECDRAWESALVDRILLCALEEENESLLVSVFARLKVTGMTQALSIALPQRVGGSVVLFKYQTHGPGW
jgi:hypothetical protein